MFLTVILCGLSFPAHKFLCGLLFAYGVQLHDLNPNIVLHITCFITLCETPLGVIEENFRRQAPITLLDWRFQLLRAARCQIFQPEDPREKPWLANKMVLRQGPTSRRQGHQARGISRC
jgi:hypothetical protein